MGLVQVVLAFCISFCSIPVLVFAIMLSAADSYWTTLAFVFWSCSQFPGLTGIILGFSKNLYLGFVHLVLVIFSFVLIELAAILNVATLTNIYVLESCVSSGWFDTDTCVHLPYRVMIVLYLVILVAPILSALAFWFSLRFIQLIRILNHNILEEQLLKKTDDGFVTVDLEGD
jgi:hypothetical protein